MSTTDDDTGQVLSPDNWGQFKPWRAAQAIFALVKGRAQHVAIALARKTPGSGVINVTHKELAAITGLGKNSIPEAMAECIAAGLLHQRRVMGGFKYTWGRVAYFPTEVGGVGRRAEKTSS